MNIENLEIGTKVIVNKQIDNETTVKAEILDTKVDKYYVHYINYNKRLDEWIPKELVINDPASIEPPKKKRKTDFENAEKSTRKSVINEKEIIDNTLRVKNVTKIQVKNFLVDAWYFSPYPKRIATRPIIYICSFCLFYFGWKEQYNEHRRECKLKHPPGNEIYRKDGLSFFEIDGHIQKNYCRNLCLLSKLFLDHKTLYYDIDPFLFYVLCREEEDGLHLVGYFSKEKESAQGYNVACLLTMPYCQRMGYGRILIDFSYLLSKKEGLIASPEKPLSDLGLLSYKKYWKEKVFAYLSRNYDKEISIKNISKETSITEDDIMGVLSAEGVLKFYDGNLSYVMNELIDEKEGVDEKCLEWEPPVRTKMDKQKM